MVVINDVDGCTISRLVMVTKYFIIEKYQVMAHVQLWQIPWLKCFPFYEYINYKSLKKTN